MNDLLETLLGYVVFAGLCVLVLVALHLRYSGLWRRLLPMQRLRPVGWTGFEVFLAFLIFLCTSVFVEVLALVSLNGAGFYEHFIGPNVPEKAKVSHAALLGGPVSFSLALLLILWMLYVRAGLRPAQVGLTRARWPANVAVAVVVFLILTPLALGIYALAILVLGETGEYALVENAKEQNLLAWEWPLQFFYAAIAVPVLEELFFRGLLMNWLRQTALAGHAMVMALALLFPAFGRWSRGMAPPDVWYNSPEAFAALLVLAYAGLLVWLKRAYLPPAQDVFRWNLPPFDAPEESADDELPMPARPADAPLPWSWRNANALLAIWGSAMLFALGHVEKWPTPIPLFVLGLGLGWLAYRTQSLLAPIVVHGLFNAVACFVLYWVVVAAPETNGKELTVAERPAVVGSTSNSVPGAWQPRRR